MLNNKGDYMKIHYLEIVTDSVDDLCESYSKLHSVTFGNKDSILGSARKSKLDNGGMIGIRAP